VRHSPVSDVDDGGAPDEAAITSINLLDSRQNEDV